jgi:FkbM family methyltransferase
MGIGAQSSFWRRMLFRSFGSTYFCRKGRTADGDFAVFVSPNSYLRVLNLRESLVDPVHQRFIRDWIGPDAVVWDIGTNLGLFAIPAALKARRGRVYGFEPDVDLAANLMRSLRLPENAGLSVSLFCLAISNLDGTAGFQISKFSRAMNKLESLGKWNDRSIVVEELRSVPTMRIDTLAQTLSPPTVIKIDVEGAEIQVLEGGEATISRYRPTMLVEGPHELWPQMGRFFGEHRYVMFDGRSEDRCPLNEPVWDTVAVPKEKVDHPYALQGCRVGDRC